jgi:release factor glutamine methyltransferase
VTVKQYLRDNKKTETELLLAHVLKKPKEFLYLNPQYKLSRYQVNKLTKLVKRRQEGEPIAYLLGHKEFFGLDFKVSKDTLVPRPETECLVEHVINTAGKNKTLKFLDVGTGSGCVIISLAKHLQGSFYGSDISKKALFMAKSNAKKHRAKIKFFHSDLLKNIHFVPDIVVANLPYGWAEWKNNSSAPSKSLKFEPAGSLFTKEKGLYEIRRLLEQIKNLPKLPKKIILEFDPRQKSLLANLIKKNLAKSKK